MLVSREERTCVVVPNKHGGSCQTLLVQERMTLLARNSKQRVNQLKQQLLALEPQRDGVMRDMIKVLSQKTQHGDVS